MVLVHYLTASLQEFTKVRVLAQSCFPIYTYSELTDSMMGLLLQLHYWGHFSAATATLMVLYCSNPSDTLLLLHLRSKSHRGYTGDIRLPIWHFFLGGNPSSRTQSMLEQFFLKFTDVSVIMLHILFHHLMTSLLEFFMVHLLGHSCVFCMTWLTDQIISD